MSSRTKLSLISITFYATSASAQSGFEARWQGLVFLVGNWIGVGGGQPGQGSGKFSFQAELNGRIVVRRNVNHVNGGETHEDLMVMYPDGSNGAFRATYFDSEGHIIRYRISTPEALHAVFESEGDGPKYRLTYWLEGKVLKGKFEVGRKTYLEWDATRDAG